ncbi:MULTISPECIES: GntR family transcriptional regulator [unclassified Mesorhizobium]|uniref:GntR family transcriptional regulator n=1 Tax=unclassified Mesorhizobium TaxID=325217 RepID=UPI000FD29C09|nr:MULTISPECIES: GntR family transcriptional regulator [unclassified Mesorhizobium]RUU74925.1 GntR family transcriptional regulator [Mesorhizobium sp. M7A.F.Ca.MR.362.00.0.0]RWN87486.1 MAG: GntR family transcriptional regulator [Mesorhizobium sp.]RWO96127.1 MAG: GntR family transcriptional regulator [Mesorhizobium sp.]TIM52500.1 MAG: GntR family transcriptional regulator [Mesorhizobium sp.]
MELEPLKKHARLGDMAYEAMKDRLVRGIFGLGRKLTVRAVADALGVSSTPARDALNRLAAEGALVYAGPKTVIVPYLTMETLKEITAMRLALEGLAAERGAAKAPAGLSDSLENMQAKINEALESRRYDKLFWTKKEFHFAVYRGCGMPHLLSTIETLWLRIGPPFHDLYPEFAAQKYGVHNHQVVIESLREGDAGAIRTAFENDIHDSYRHLKQAIRAREEQVGE